MKSVLPLLGLAAAFAVVAPALAVSVSLDELAQARQWAAARFEGTPRPPPTEAALVLLANHDGVQKNGRHGRPLRLGEREFTRGLYCHAPS